jgi:hypothetical protein
VITSGMPPAAPTQDVGCWPATLRFLFFVSCSARASSAWRSRFATLEVDVYPSDSNRTVSKKLEVSILARTGT